MKISVTECAVECPPLGQALELADRLFDFDGEPVRLSVLPLSETWEVERIEFDPAHRSARIFVRTRTVLGVILHELLHLRDRFDNGFSFDERLLEKLEGPFFFNSVRHVWDIHVDARLASRGLPAGNAESYYRRLFVEEPQIGAVDLLLGGSPAENCDEDMTFQRHLASFQFLVGDVPKGSRPKVLRRMWEYFGGWHRSWPDIIAVARTFYRCKSRGKRKTAAPIYGVLDSEGCAKPGQYQARQEHRR